MNALLKKLNFKTQSAVLVINLPLPIKSLIEDWKDFITINFKPSNKPIEFVVIFCTTLKDVAAAASLIETITIDDPLVWIAYPKGTSKNYTSEFNRDNGWEALGKIGWEPVRMVAIDNDWSALRFRKPDHIKTMSRSFAITTKGKAKVASQKKIK
jgi:hypothetical protein